MYNKNLLADKRILVTGAGSGIGRAVAVNASRLGAQIVLVGRDENKLAETYTLLAGKENQCISFDLYNFEDYSELFSQCTTEGKLDGMIHCAGIAKALPLRVLSEKNIDEIFDINFKSFVFLVKFFSKKTISNEQASIVLCSAVNAHLHQQKCMEIYEASKLAAEGFVSGTAAELYSGRKIRINSMVIGPVATPMAGSGIEKIGVQADLCPNLMGIAAPEDISNMAIYLLSDLSNYTTGRNMYVDGGVALNVYGK